MIKLTVKDKSLYAGEAMLMRVYDAGDCDTCAWPMSRLQSRNAKQRGNLAMALFDAREMGHLGNDCVGIVQLPNGKEFDFDAELCEYEQVNPRQLQEY